jgi:Skp family chaperone for outer membrane proteins
VAGLVGLGVVAGMIIAPVRAQSTFASIGYVDVQTVLESHPQYTTVMQQIQSFRQAKYDEINALQQGATTDEQRQAVVQRISQVQDEISNEGTRLTDPLIQSVIDTTKAIGQESGIEVILEGSSVMYGGLDLTPLVVARIQGN